MEETATIKFDLKRVRKTGVHTHRAPFAELLLKPVLLSLLHGSLSRLRQTFSSPATSPPPSLPIQRGILSFLTIPLSPLLPLPTPAPHSSLAQRLSRYFRVLIVIACKETGEKRTEIENSFGGDHFPTTKRNIRDRLFRYEFLLSFSRVIPCFVEQEEEIRSKRINRKITIFFSGEVYIYSLDLSLSTLEDARAKKFEALRSRNTGG